MQEKKNIKLWIGLALKFRYLIVSVLVCLGRAESCLPTIHTHNRSNCKQVHGKTCKFRSISQMPRAPEPSKHFICRTSFGNRNCRISCFFRPVFLLSSAGWSNRNAMLGMCVWRGWSKRMKSESAAIGRSFTKENNSCKAHWLNMKLCLSNSLSFANLFEIWTTTTQTQVIRDFIIVFIRCRYVSVSTFQLTTCTRKHTRMVGEVIHLGCSWKCILFWRNRINWNLRKSISARCATHQSV